jgi:predicted transcriptional regulator
MEQLDFFNYFESAEKQAQFITDEQKDNLMLHLCEQGVSYPTEISRVCDLHPEIVNRILYELKKKGFIEKVTPPEQPCEDEPLFLGIIPEMNRRGIIGYQSFVRFSWWTMTLTGFLYIKSKFKGQHKPIKASLVHHLGLEETL